MNSSADGAKTGFDALRVAQQALIEQWSRLAQSFGMQLNATAGQPFGSFFFGGAFGPAPQQPPDTQQWLALTEKFRTQFERLNQYWVEVGRVAAADFSAQLASRQRLDDTPLEMRALYDLWVDCAEDSYSKTAHNDEFVALLAEMFNLLARCRIERQKMLEPWAADLDLPTRAEMNSLHRTVKELRASVRALTPFAAAQKKPRASR
jgi:polyhydroxyalkanoate synthase subunit PhaE